MKTSILRKTVAWMLALAMVMTVNMGVFATETVSADMVLTISGTGEMPDVEIFTEWPPDKSYAPWAKYPPDTGDGPIYYLIVYGYAGSTAKATKVIPAIGTPKLSAAVYTFDGKTKTPAVTVPGAAKGTYTVTYAKGRKNVGTYKVTVTLKGADYYGSKTVAFKINPKGLTVKKLTKPAKKQIKVTWSKPASKYRKQIDGYQIRYSTKSSMKNAKTVKVKGTKATSKTIKKLKAKKKYYVQIRTYNKVGKTTYYSGWSKAKSVKTK